MPNGSRVYAAAMSATMSPASAGEVAAALRARHPGLQTVKLHKLLYYCQGHHLATFGRPLFHEQISAWDMGPVVGALWRAENDDGPGPVGDGDLGQAQLNTVGYVLSRYGGLSGRDLMHLTHSEQPWRTADASRPPGMSSRIANAWIEEYFRAAELRPDEEPLLDAAEVQEWLRSAIPPTGTEPPSDDGPELVRRLAELRSRAGGRG